MSALLCGHWTFFRIAGEDVTARCDLNHGHEGLHRHWHGLHDTFSWADSAERHRRRSSNEANLGKPVSSIVRTQKCWINGVCVSQSHVHGTARGGSA